MLEFFTSDKVMPCRMQVDPDTRVPILVVCEWAIASTLHRYQRSLTGLSRVEEGHGKGEGGRQKTVLLLCPYVRASARCPSPHSRLPSICEEKGN